MLAGLTVLFLVTVLGVLAYRLMQPRWYMAQVTIEYAPPETGPASPAEAVRKKEVLYPVIDQLGLTKGYAREGSSVTREQAFEFLLSSMRIEVDSRTPLRDFSQPPPLVRIGVYDHDPVRAANIANTVAMVFRNRLREDEAARSGSLGERTLSDSPIRILERAVPPATPIPWWRGDPR